MSEEDRTSVVFLGYVAIMAWCMAQEAGETKYVPEKVLDAIGVMSGITGIGSDRLLDGLKRIKVGNDCFRCEEECPSRCWLRPLGLDI